MLRKFVLASIAAASVCIALPSISTSASAEGGPRYSGGYGGDHGRGYGPPPWVMRRWHGRRHHHFGPPAYEAPRRGHFHGRPGPQRPHW